ncbi:MAG TPA: flavin reductase family protein [Planktothrix sp.]|jgi:flavin reductase (DIM6/NTAB) family NADH-FMN oxidoreductase RutF
MSSVSIDTENLGKALGRVASGVYVVTLTEKSERDGMLATFIGQVAFEPPMVSIAVKRERPILPKLPAGAKFAVNVLGKKNTEIFKHFAKPFAEGVDRFAGLRVEDKPTGPVLSECVSYIGCRVISQAEAGDHIVVLAEVIEGAMLDGEQEPMVHLRKNGFQY